LLGKEYKERTAWNSAARMGYISQILKQWEWAKQELTTEELHNRILLATDVKERTAWHEVIERGNTELIKEIWYCVKRN